MNESGEKSSLLDRESSLALILPGHRPGMRRRFVVAISLLVALVLTAQGAVLMLFGYSYLEEAIETRAQSFATLATAPLCDAYLKYFESGHSKFLELVGSVVKLNSDLISLAIFDIEGLERYRTGPSNGSTLLASVGAAPMSTDPERLLKAIRGLDLKVWREDDETETVLVIVAPYIEEWGRHQFTVVYRFSFAGVRSAVLNIATQVGLLSLFGLFLGVLCAFVLSAQSLRPVEKLIRGARALADGRLDQRIRLRSGDELEVLGATLDQMAELLSRTVDDLEGSNARLNRMNRELQELDKVKSDLLANVSHELRTPLTAISGYVEALRSGLLGELQPSQVDALKVVERNIVRLRGMIDQLLSYSRIESGRLDVDPRPFDLEAAARLVLEAVQAAHGKNHKLRLETEQQLPEVYGDASRISQVLENLLTNAVKFSPPGSEITVTLATVHDKVEVKVQDRGIGIPAELHSKIFDRFYQVDSSSRRNYGGMGLGLAIVKEILELHGSKITVASQTGQGATFRFALPIAAERTGYITTALAPTVVFVDDDAPFVQRMTTLLGQQGINVHAAPTAEQGFTLAQKARPRLVVVDRLLPDGDGFDLLKQIKADPKIGHVPVALCTIRREKALGMRLGAVAYWIKPIDPEDLAMRIKALVAPTATG